MEITLDKIERTQGIIKISVNRDDFQPGVDQKIKEYSKTAEIKGFRKGRVPAGMIKKMYGNALIVDEINKLVSDKLNNYLKEEDTQFLGEPLPASTDNIYDWENQDSFDFNYEIGFAEPFDLKIDKKQKFEKYFIEVDDQVVNETIENLKRQFAEIENPDFSSEGDIVLGNAIFKTQGYNKDISIDLREVEKNALKKLLGAKKGETIELDIKKTFKNELALRNQLHQSEEEFKKLKGKFDFTIHTINHHKEVEINQEFYDRTFGKDIVKSYTAFIEKIKEVVAKNYITESENYFNYQIREKLLDQANIELPDEFLKKWLLRTNDNLTEEQLENEYSAYAKDLKWSLIRNKIVADQAIKVEHEEILEEAKNMIRSQFGSMGMGEQMESQLDAFANNYLQGENGNNYMKMYNQVQNEKVFDFIKQNTTVKEKTVTLEEFRKL